MKSSHSTPIGRAKAKHAMVLAAFTLVELLTVIAIIGALASLVVGLSGLAGAKNKEFRAKSELNGLITAIESYKAEIGAFPPDGLRNDFTGDAAKTNFLHFAHNPLYYELSGATFTNDGGKGYYTPLNKGLYDPTTKVGSVAADDLKSAVGLSGVQNSAREKIDVKYKGSNFKASQYAELKEFPEVNVLTAPLPPVGDHFLEGKTIPKLNPWLYDSSTTNRHNRRGFDIWIQYTAGKKTNIIGNWK